MFYVNWFRKDAEGNFLWPGFGENGRVLEWVFERCRGAGRAVRTPIGILPAPGAVNTAGLDLSDTAMASLLTVDPDDWRAEIPLTAEASYYRSLGERVPSELIEELSLLEDRFAGDG